MQAGELPPLKARWPIVPNMSAERAAEVTAAMGLMGNGGQRIAQGTRISQRSFEIFVCLALGPRVRARVRIDTDDDPRCRGGKLGDLRKL